VGDAPELLVDADLPRDLTAAGLARARLDVLGATVDRAQLDALRIVVTELVNNAVVHGEGRIALQVTLEDGLVRGQVLDEGTGFAPQLGEEPARDETREVGGWGLPIVDAVAARWGVFEGTTHVWFELAATGT